MSRSIRRFTLALFLALAGTPAAHAQGLIIPRPIAPVPRPQPLAVKSQHVTMQVNSGAMKVEVEQVFYNPNPAQMEGTYLFPLPEGAAVSSFRMTIDKEPTEGKILTVEEARRVYETYVRQHIDPAILEYVGRNAFQARVFPIPAGGEKHVFLAYSQPLAFENGVYRAVYPLNSERVTNGTAGDLTIDCTIRSAQPLKAVYSPTHEVQVSRQNDHLARVSYEGKDVRANRDFLLYYSTSEKAFGLNALANRRAGEDGYLMLMLAPKREVASSEIQPKDVVFVFDTSGSMQGEKIDQARKALQTVLGALNERDRFNIIRFSSDVTQFKETVVPASTENREAARKFVEEFKAVGGTNIDDALDAGLASLPKTQNRAGHAPFLIFMTDGLPTIGQTDVQQILEHSKKAAPADLRLFSFGVGSDVNTLLLDRLAGDNRGAADYIAPNEDLEARIGSFYTKIADPVLSNVKITVNGATVKDVYPSKIPDLFAGSQLLILSRYEGQGAGTVTLTGEVNGKAQKFEYPVMLPDRQTENEFIPKLWASRRIGFLLENIRLNGEKAELKDEVIRLSKEYGIVTPYTAYLVEEPGVRPPILRGRGAEFGEVDRLSTFGGAVGGGGFGGQGGANGQVPGARAPLGGAPAGPAGPPGPTGRDAPKPAQRPQSATVKLRAETEAQQQRSLQQLYGLNQSTGWNAVEASKSVRELKDQAVTGDTGLDVRRTIEGRAFRLASGIWIDQTATPKMATVPVKYGSDAYFRLISSNKEWARFLSLGKRVTFRTGKNTVVTVDQKGKEKLTDAEVAALSK